MTHSEPELYCFNGVAVHLALLSRRNIRVQRPRWTSRPHFTLPRTLMVSRCRREKSGSCTRAVGKGRSKGRQSSHIKRSHQRKVASARMVVNTDTSVQPITQSSKHVCKRYGTACLPRRFPKACPHLQSISAVRLQVANPALFASPSPCRASVASRAQLILSHSYGACKAASI